MKYLYSVIAIESIAIVILSFFLFKQPEPSVSHNFFGDGYKRAQDSCDNLLKAKDNILNSLEKRISHRDTLRIGNFNNAKTEHEKINHFNDTTRNAFWTEYFSTKGIYK